MKIKTDRQLLNASLTLAKKAVPSRAIIPETSCVLLEGKKNTLVLRSTDTTISILTQIEADISGDTVDSLCVPAETLSGIISNLNTDEVTLDLEENLLRVTAGKARASVKSLPSQDFPSLPVPHTKIATLPAALIQKIKDLFVPFVVQDESSDVLQGVYVFCKDGELKIVARDHFRGSYLHQTFDANDFGVNIPGRGKSILKECSGNTELWLNESGSQVILKTGNGQFSTTLLPTNVPETWTSFGEMLEKPLSAVNVESSDLLNAVRLVAVMSNNVNHRVDLEVKEKSITVTSLEAERGEGKNQVDCTLKGEPFSVMLDASYLIQILEPLRGLGLTVRYATGTFFSIAIEENSEFIHGISPLGQP